MGDLRSFQLMHEASERFIELSDIREKSQYVYEHLEHKCDEAYKLWVALHAEHYGYEPDQQP